MITEIVRNTSWSHLKDYLSFSFFKTVSPKALTKSTTTLIANRFKKKRFLKEQKLLAAKIKEKLEGVVLIDQATKGINLQKFNSKTKKQIGEAILRLYFFQLMHSSFCVLDFNLHTFSWQKDKLLWNPETLWYSWKESFLDAVREVYFGFYLNNQKRYDQGIKALGLDGTQALFAKHFGLGDQTKVIFRQKDFLDSFHEIFLCCQKNKLKIDPQLIVLGVYLANLYQSLEKLGQAYDVRGAFLEVIGS